MHQVRMEAERRAEGGKQAARALRRQGGLPANYYGYGEPATMLKLDARRFTRALTHDGAEHALINLTIDGEDALAIIKEIQRHPVRHDVLHVDFQAIRMDEEITVETEVTLDGEPRGVAEGGILEFNLRTLLIRALPMNVPSSIHIDVSDLGVNQALHVAGVPAPEGVTILTDPDMVIVSVAVPRAQVEEVAEAEEVEEEMAEPELVGEEEEREDEDEGDS